MIQKFVKRQKKKLKWPPSFINRIFNFDKNILSIPFGRNCLLILIIQHLEWIKKPSTLHTVIYNTDTCTRVNKNPSNSSLHIYIYIVIYICICKLIQLIFLSMNMHIVFLQLLENCHWKKKWKCFYACMYNVFYKKISK